MKIYFNIKKFLALLVLVTVLFACEKSEVGDFQAEPAVNFSRINNQFAVSYTFLTNPTGEYVQKIPVKIMGFSTDRDRQFKVEVVEGVQTSATSDQYEILSCIVPAGSYDGTLSVKLLNSPLLKDSVVSLKLRIADATDFKKGNMELNEFTVNWTDKIIVPAWNVYYRTFFAPAASSNVYRLFVQITGLTSFLAADYRLLGEPAAIALGTQFGDYIKQWELDNGRHFVYDDGANRGQRVLPVHYTRSKYD